MYLVFMVCAILGGTILVCQFVLTIIGMGDHGDASLDVGDAGDVGGIGDVGHVGDVGHDVSVDGHDAAGGHGSTWLFGVISFRTLVAASTFFGLAGLAAQSANLPLVAQLLIALVSGVAAMYGVHFLMRSLYKLSTDGTVRIDRAVGHTGTVYIPISANRKSAGKIQINLQNRLIEYEAITGAAEALPTGAKVVVVAVVGENTLEVEPAPMPVEASKS